MPTIAATPEDLIFGPADGVAVSGILAEAARATSGERHRSYGNPEENHARTAEMFAAYLRGRLITMARDAFPAGVPDELAAFLARVDLTARDTCILNILQKCSREAHAPKRDNLVDIAGYAANAGTIDDAMGKGSGVGDRGSGTRAATRGPAPRAASGSEDDAAQRRVGAPSRAAARDTDGSLA